MKFLKDKDGVRYIQVFIFTCVIILVVTVAYFFVVNCLSGSDRGTFGDLFGGINAVFSGFAFAGVIITILMQMKELEETRIELRKSAIAQDETQKALNLQLKNMENSTRIESVKNFIEAYKAEYDKKEVAKAILEKLVEEVFYDREFFSLVKPLIEITEEPKFVGIKSFSHGFSFERHDKSKMDHICIEFQNKGASYVMKESIIEGSHIEPIEVRYFKVLIDNTEFIPQERYLQLKNEDLIERNSNYLMTISNFKDEKTIIIRASIVGEFVKHNYELEFKIEITESNIHCKIFLRDELI